MEPVKVLVIGHDARLGGAQHSLLEILERLTSENYLPIVLVPTPGPFVQAVRGHGLKCLWGLTQRWVFFKKRMTASVLLYKPWRILMHPYLLGLISLMTMPVRIILLAVLARKESIGLVYSNTITVLDGALLARLLGIPHVWHLRETVAGNMDLSFPFSLGWLPGFVLGWSDCVIVNSLALRRQLFGVEGRNKVRVVPNGIDVNMLAHCPVCLSFPFIPDGAQVTAIVGRLNENKGITDYLKALAFLQDIFPDAHHLIIGEGDPAYETFLREEVIELGLGDRVHFLGYRRDVRDLMTRVDILVSASYRESFGRTLIEAMAAGVPVISTRSGGPEEIIVDGECGFLVDVGDVTAIADRIARLLGDPGLAQAFGAAGRRRVIECFDLKNTTKEIARVIEEALVRQK